LQLGLETEFLKEAAEAMPQAQRKTLADQAHQVSPEALEPVLVEFFTE
jgi:hypothetical protein